MSTILRLLHITEKTPLCIAQFLADYREMHRAFEDTSVCVCTGYFIQIVSYFNEEELVGRLQIEVVCLNVISVDANCSLDVLFLQKKKNLM